MSDDHIDLVTAQAWKQVIADGYSMCMTASDVLLFINDDTLLRWHANGCELGAPDDTASADDLTLHCFRWKR